MALIEGGYRWYQSAYRCPAAGGHFPAGMLARHTASTGGVLNPLFTLSFLHPSSLWATGEGFFALSKVDYKIEPSEMSKANTALQLALISMALSHVVWGMPPEAAISGLSWLTGATTLWTWWDYFQSTGRTAIKRE